MRPPSRTTDPDFFYLNHAQIQEASFYLKRNAIKYLTHYLSSHLMGASALFTFSLDQVNHSCCNTRGIKDLPCGGYYGTPKLLDITAKTFPRRSNRLIGVIL
jgi:hypothetical protein